MKTNNPSPLVPQGTLPDKTGKSRVQFTVLTILAVHAVVLGVVLLQGCKRTATDPNLELQALATNYPPPDAFAPPPSTPPPQVAQIPQPPPTQVETQPPPVIVTQPVEPTPVVAVTPQPLAASASQHVVVKGDSFSTIAKKYGVTARAVSDANPGVDSTRLKIGQKLTVPPPTVRTATGATGSAANGGDKTYVVRSGDTLFKIAKTHGVSAKALRGANNLRTDQIKVGQKLVIPGKNGSPAIESGVGGTDSQATPLP
jgi:LysM repeat protein